MVNTRKISIEELESHNSKESAWINIDNKIYDVTKWIKHHPGGRAAIINVAGRDATDLMRQFHKPELWTNKIHHWYVGDLAPAEHAVGSPEYTTAKNNAAIAKEFRELGQWMEDNGWYVSDKSYYAGKAVQLAVLFIAAWWFMFDGVSAGEGHDPKWTFYASAFALGLFWQQCNFIGHDVGHTSVLHSSASHQKLGFVVGNLLTGLSLCWWKHSHETHHVATNVISHDPDIQHLPVFAISDKMFKWVKGKGAGVFSSYWNAFMPFDAAASFFVSYQHILFFPVMSVARFNLWAQSLLFVFTHEKSHGWKKIGEILSLAAFYGWYGYLMSFCPTYASMLAYWYISFATVGIIHVQICLSHFLMDTYEEVPYQKDTENYYQFQLRTTLDIDCPEWLDWFHGGLYSFS